MVPLGLAQVAALAVAVMVVAAAVVVVVEVALVVAVRVNGEATPGASTGCFVGGFVGFSEISSTSEPTVIIVAGGWCGVRCGYWGGSETVWDWRWCEV